MIEALCRKDPENTCAHCAAEGFLLCCSRRGMHCTACGRPWTSVAGKKRQEDMAKRFDQETEAEGYAVAVQANRPGEGA